MSAAAKEETPEDAEIRRNRLEAEEMSKKFTGQGSGAATMRLISDLQQLDKVQGRCRLLTVPSPNFVKHSPSPLPRGPA